MYRLRFIRMMLQSLFVRPLDLLDTFELRFIVIPFLDTDFSRLFTHTYAALMGLARWHFVFGSKFRLVALKHKWAPVTATERIEYKKSIRAFERVTLKTRLLCWNEQRFYLEHIFSVQGKVYAHCHVEGLVRGPEGVLCPPEVFRLLDVNQPSPEFPQVIRSWIDSRGAIAEKN